MQKKPPQFCCFGTRSTYAAAHMTSTVMCEWNSRGLGQPQCNFLCFSNESG